jgi:competence protein ComEA
MNLSQSLGTRAVWLLVIVLLFGVAALIYRQTSAPGSTEILILAPSPEIRAYVDGAVANPGVYLLRDGDLLLDAVQAAGGFTADAHTSSVNLAAPVRDGEHVYVYSLGEMPQKVNINTADAWLLESLPGIGELLAQRIIDHRECTGGFRSIEELTQVDGIGVATFEMLEDRVSVR